MPRPIPPFSGACLCGAVTVHVTVPPMLTLACHCRDCQKLTASDYSLTTMFPSDGVRCTGPMITGGYGTTARKHYFCKSCLTFIYSQIDGAEHRINLRTSILDAAANLPPFIELMTDEKLPWAQVQVRHSYGQFPASLDELAPVLEEYANQ